MTVIYLDDPRMAGEHLCWDADYTPLLVWHEDEGWILHAWDGEDEITWPIPGHRGGVDRAKEIAEAVLVDRMCA